MRHTLMSLTMALPLLSLAACDSPDDEAELQELDQLAELEDDADLPPSAETFDLTSTSGTASKCYCWTACSSNGHGWTKSYYVGAYNTKPICDNHAKSFCKGKASDYKYANSGCGTHP